jgi:hypothetical protein
MSRIEFIDADKEIKGVLIDGYFTDFSSLKQIDWEKAASEKISDDKKLREDFFKLYERHLLPEKEIPTELTQTRTLKDLMYQAKMGHCPYDGPICKRLISPARMKGAQDVERVVKRFFEPETRVKILPEFRREIEKDISEGKKGYFFISNFLDLKEGEYCNNFDECTKNWMDFFDFRTKDKSEYMDFQAYKCAAEGFLKASIDYGVEKMYWFNRRERPTIYNL